VPYLSALEVRSRRGAIQIHVYLYLYLYFAYCLVILSTGHFAYWSFWLQDTSPTRHFAYWRVRLLFGHFSPIRQFITFTYRQGMLKNRDRPIPCRRPIPNTIGHSYNDTGLYKFFVLKMQFCAGYRYVQVIYVCKVYVRKYGIDFKL